MSMLMGVGEPGASPYSAMSALMKVNDAESFIQNYSQTLTAMAKWGKEANIPFYQFSDPEQIKVGDQAAIKVAMDVSNILAATGQVGEAQEAMKRLFGDDLTLDFYLAVVDQDTVAMAYISQENLVRTIAAGTKSAATLADDASVAQTAAMLRSDSQWIMYLSPQGAFQFASNMAGLFSPEGKDAKFPSFPKSPPVGVSANVLPSTIDAELVAPAATLSAVASFIQSMGEAK